jgi:dolichyl-phosphate beta-glucosyltransferase
MIKKLSIIFPLFNEEKRLTKTFNEICKFKKKTINRKLEFFFIDDGSSDKSPLLIDKFIKKNNSKNFKIKYFKLRQNMGKGYALKYGVQKSTMPWILTTDTDLSVPLSQIFEWEKFKELEKEKIIFGSRNLKDSKVKKKYIRFFLGKLFSFSIKHILNISLADTQCGFKLYKKKIAKNIFTQLSNFGFTHDLEIVLISKGKKIKIKEFPVKWTHRDGSKLNIFYDSLIMFINIFLLRIKHHHLIN